MKLPKFEEVKAEINDDSYAGWCTNCGDWTHDSCEPYARNYRCPVCKKNTCYGTEELIFENLFE